ncbi:hypothetical protein E1091_18230 [Micromonospora fluostatini]|uniref:Uncharacterized protein n=1 Tax=Micromonospora fluostatini TaxID=1629071 RepID=A0ABY2DD40_9ACTN|nr:hypothetical protein E1091_18230 [Micromonospora fluostatini]
MDDGMYTDRASLWRQINRMAASIDQMHQAPGTPGKDGTDGLSVELRATGTAIQWRQTGGTWADLVALAAITGPKGIQGDRGLTGTVGAMRIATPVVPALILGASADITATWRTPMPNATYAVDWAIPASLLGRITVALKTQTTTGAVLTVTAGLAVASANLTVLAWAP